MNEEEADPVEDRGLSVSVIIPLYNAGHFLKEAVDSVRAQTYRAHEIIIVDDGSTDGSLAVARSLEPHVKVFSQTNKGAAEARNFAVSQSRSELLAFLDADDLWDPRKLEKQIQVLTEQTGIHMVFGHVQQFHDTEGQGSGPGTSPGTSPEASRDRQVLPGLVQATMLIRRQDYLRVGLLDTKWKVGEFLDWYARACEKGLKSYMLPDVIYRRRIHGANLGIREKKSHSDYIKILKETIDRRRRLGGIG